MKLLLKYLVIYLLVSLAACGGSDESSDEEGAGAIDTGTKSGNPDDGRANESADFPVRPLDNVQFTDVTSAAGIDHVHAFDGSGSCRTGYELEVAGVAAGDYDNDGDIDLYVPTGSRYSNVLYRNNGDGTFSNVAEDAGVAMPPDEDGNGCSAAPLFFDYDGDGHLDLLVNAINQFPSQLFRNLGNGQFTNATAISGIFTDRNLSLSSAASDYDRDGDLDLFIAHWGSTVYEGESTQHFWRNEGNGSFTDISVESGIRDAYPQVSNIAGEDNITDFSFTPIFADYNDDGWPDLFVASDFGTSLIFRNMTDGTYSNVTSEVISDENGMGAAVEDYDNDGDLDWFVASIFDPDGEVTSPENWGTTGNRLYKNIGDGKFEDATDEAGVREGSWGWGSCFADFNNDGWLDLFHVNGFNYVLADPEYGKDRSRLFISNQDGSFTEYSFQAGIRDYRQGRGISCFDYDRDGDIDIFIANNNQPPRLYRNDLGNLRNHLTVKLLGKSSNTEAIGARVYVITGTQRQMRAVKAGNNYVSQNPAEAHFGLNDHEHARLRIKWPSGQHTNLGIVEANQYLVIDEP